MTIYGGIKAPGFPPGTQLFSWTAFGVYLGFLGSQIALHLLLPGTTDKGVKLRDGSQLEYKFTGNMYAQHLLCCCRVTTVSHRCLPCAGKFNLLITLLAAFYFGFYTGTLNLAWVYDNYVPLTSAAVFTSITLSIVLYAASFR